MTEQGIVGTLRHAGYRVTQPRRAVIQVLLGDEGYSSPMEIRDRARTVCPTVGTVTVYRTLSLLSKLGFVRRIHTEDGCHGYTVANHGHHHHLVCRQCGAAVEFAGCDLSPLLSRVGDETGYEIEAHLLELTGLCPGCQETLHGQAVRG